MHACPSCSPIIIAGKIFAMHLAPSIQSPQSQQNFVGSYNTRKPHAPTNSVKYQCMRGSLSQFYFRVFCL